MSETRASTLLLMLMAIIILLMVAIAGLFLRMNQLQRQVLAALSGGPAGVPAQDVGLPVAAIALDFTWWTNQWKTEPGPAGCTWCSP